MAVKNVITKRGYSEIKDIHAPTPKEREEFESMEKAAGIDHVNLLIADTDIVYAGAVTDNPTYRGVKGDYVVVSEPEMHDLTALDPQVAEAHELYHVIIERAEKRSYESFSDEEIKRIELDADRFACLTLNNKAAVEAHLRGMTAYNERLYEKKAVFWKILFPNVDETIRESVESGGARHPSLSERLRNIDLISLQPVG